jgi:phage baseplate assembly protein W
MADNYTTYIYSDVNPEVIDNKPPLIVDSKAIQRSIHNILSTTPGERLFLPDFGVNIPDYLFELMDDITSFQLEDLITSGILRWEPRINLQSVSVFPDVVNSAYYLSVIYSIKGLDSSRLQEFSLKVTS